MSAKAGTKKQQKEATVVAVPEKVVIEEKAPEKDVILKETETSAFVEEETLSITNDDNNEENDEINSEEIISSEKYIDNIKQKNLLIQEEAKTLSSMSSYLRSELIKIEKEEINNAKAKFDLEKKQIKFKFSILKKSAPKAKKNLDSDGNKIQSEGKNPVTWYDFAKEAFKLESNDGFGSKYLQHVWELIKSEAGTKNGSSIIISNPGATNTFFKNIKRVMEERGLNTEKEKEVHALIEKGVLANTDITKFSKYCYEEKEKKPKATKKTKAV